MEIKTIQVQRHCGHALSSVLCYFIVQPKERKARDGEKENFVSGKVQSSRLWEVVAVFLCTLYFVCDVISIFF